MEGSSRALLLSTKLTVPAPREDYIVRTSLFSQLSHNLDKSVIFICSGTGTGKTTLLSSFIKETGLAPVEWVSLDASNTNAYTFWLYITAAVSAFWEDDGNLLALMRANPDASHMENLLTLLINRICANDVEYYLVLDDVHCIHDATLIRMLEFFFSAMPPNFHLFMLSREDPPVYLGSLAMSGKLFFIDAKKMQFAPDEGIAFLKHTLKLQADDEELTRLNTYAEGWVGGLQLAAASGIIGSSFGHLLRAGGGIAASYLTREMFTILLSG
ncbi:MAG: hypothetical protein LKE40_04445 [Spirochaetia bacterium]|nr:hypothetical protein [Spirochaetia bacterium]